MCHVCVQRKGEGKKTLSDEESPTFSGGEMQHQRELGRRKGQTISEKGEF